MMECTDYRKSILADPRRPSTGMLAHVAACHDCTQYTERLLRFEGHLEQALRVDLETTSEGRSAPFQLGSRLGRASRIRRRGFAIAASVLLAVIGAGSLWLAAPGRSLAADVVSHMAGEPDAWTRTEIPVPAPQLSEVLSESDVRLKPSAGLVSYASSCLFRGYQVPHLVVQSETGPITVMVLEHESVRRGMHFDEQGYRGMIVPVRGHGSLAVLEQGANGDVKAMERVAARVLGAIEWTK